MVTQPGKDGGTHAWPAFLRAPPSERVPTAACFPACDQRAGTVRLLQSRRPPADQYVDPWVIVGDDGQPVGAVRDGDAVVTFNFRADRMVEISQALEYEHFDKFDRKRWPKVGAGRG